MMAISNTKTVMRRAGPFIGSNSALVAPRHLLGADADRRGGFRPSAAMWQEGELRMVRARTAV